MLSYYRLLYQLDGEQAFLLWFSNGSDGVVVRDGRLLSFSDETVLYRFARQYGLNWIDEAPILHDLDEIQRWVLCPRGRTLDCSAVLMAWNLFVDLARSLSDAGLGLLEVDGAHEGLYRKLFFGNNLSAITPEGERYDPTWSGSEVVEIANLLALGLELFRQARDKVAR